MLLYKALSVLSALYATVTSAAPAGVFKSPNPMRGLASNKAVEARDNQERQAAATIAGLSRTLFLLCLDQIS